MTWKGEESYINTFGVLEREKKKREIPA